MSPASDASRLFRTLGIHFITEGHHHCREGWLQLHCPYCPRNNYHMGFRIRAKYFSCWRCGRLPLMSTLSKLSGRPYGEISGLVEDLPSLPDIKRRHTGTLTLPAPLLPLRELPAHRKYLRRRRFDWEEIAEVWKVQGLEAHPRFKWRLFIPITLEWEVMSFTTRSINPNSTLRYLSAEEQEEKMSHKDLIYGEDFCQHSIAIVEGATDSWRIGPGAGALCGTGFKRSQLLRLSKFARRIVCFDSEPGAQKRARSLCRSLAPFDGETFNIVLDSNDPGSATDREIRQIRKLLRG
jgi:hypothetical protein